VRYCHLRGRRTANAAKPVSLSVLLFIYHHHDHGAASSVEQYDTPLSFVFFVVTTKQTIKNMWNNSRSLEHEQSRRQTQNIELNRGRERREEKKKKLYRFLNM
jgi:hypothetical protein